MYMCIARCSISSSNDSASTLFTIDQRAKRKLKFLCNKNLNQIFTFRIVRAHDSNCVVCIYFEADGSDAQCTLHTRPSCRTIGIDVSVNALWLAGSVTCLLAFAHTFGVQGHDEYEWIAWPTEPRYESNLFFRPVYMRTKMDIFVVSSFHFYFIREFFFIFFFALALWRVARFISKCLCSLFFFTSAYIIFDWHGRYDKIYMYIIGCSICMFCCCCSMFISRYFISEHIFSVHRIIFLLLLVIDVCSLETLI